MSYFVYILLSEKDKKLYVGCASNLENRLKAHNQGKVSATCNRRPMTIIHSEEFTDKGKAFQRERYLKTVWSARFKSKIKKEYLDKIAHRNI